jgi:hypothetical protein
MADNPEEALRRWRLILGPQADPEEEVTLDKLGEAMDRSLTALYDSDREGGLGSSQPNINRWLGDIRKYFPSPSVQLMQKDALHRLGLERMLMEPELLETLEPDVELVATLISLNQVMPEKTRATAREVVQRLLQDLLRRLEAPLRQAVRGSLNRAERNYRPRFREIDWPKTILANLKHYQPDLQTIIPERLVGQGRKGRALRDIILLVDQSASMAGSLVYAGIMGSILASLPSLKTHLIFFDTQVADLTEKLDDPIELLFGAQLGGGTDIEKAFRYAGKRIRQPKDTLLVLISDLYEGGDREVLLRRVREIVQGGSTVVSLLALDDKGAPAYDREIASAMAGLGIPVFACTPDQFPDLMATAIRRQDLGQWMAREGIVRKA